MKNKCLQMFESMVENNQEEKITHKNKQITPCYLETK